MTRIVVETFTRMAKRSLVLMAVLAAMLAAVAVPAFAQQGPATTTATGVLVGPVDDGDQDPTPEYRLTDEATGTNYVLISGFVELEPFAGQRVTIAGVPIGGADNAPPALNVTQIELADEDEDPSPSDKATLSFELTVDGDPPAGTVFSGNVRTGEGGPGLFVPLTDPNEDRVYTGSTTVDRFGPGPRPVPPGVEPVSFPVRIVQDSSEVIKDFGTVKLDGDKIFEASVSFPVDDCPIISPTPEQCGDGSDDGSTDDGSDDNAGSGGFSGGSDSGGSVADSGSSVSGGSGSVDYGGSSASGSSGSGDSGSGGTGSGGTGSGGSGSGGSGNDAEGSGSSGGVTSGVKGLLPSTGGGMALTVLVAGVLLIGGGLLIRRLVR